MGAMRKPRTKITEFEEKDLSIKAIEVRPEILQSRHTTDIGFSRAYARAMADGSIFPPVLVFFDGEKYWLADGFTRVHARESLGLPTIRAVIRPGTVEDALLAGIEANFDPYHSRSVVTEDRYHAVELILRNMSFWTWPDKEIGRRCGITSVPVRRIREQVARELSIPMPDRVVIFKDGKPSSRTFPYRVNRGNDRKLHVSQSRPGGGGKGVYIKVRGEREYLGRDPASARTTWEKYCAIKDASQKRLADTSSFKDWLLRQRILAESTDRGVIPLCGLFVGDVAIEPISDGSLDRFLEKVARLLLRRVALPNLSRSILVGYLDDGVSAVTKLIPHAVALGIEVMTPEEFVAEFGPAVASIKGDGGDPQDLPATDTPDAPGDGLDTVKVQTVDQFLAEFHSKDNGGDDDAQGPPATDTPDAPDDGREGPR